MGMMFEIKSRIAPLKKPHKCAMHSDPHYALDLFCVLTTAALAAPQNKALRSINSCLLKNRAGRESEWTE